MTDAPQPSPAPASANSRLLGLAALALIALVIAFAWRRAAGRPDTTRVDAARASARPHFAAFQRCLLGAPLAAGERPGQRLRNVILAYETLTPDVEWPRRCATHAQAVLTALAPVRAEDARVDQVVAALWSARIALARGRAPTGVDALWEAAARITITGAAPPSGVAAPRAPLRPLLAADAAAAVVGARRERALAVEPGRLLLAEAALRVCRLDGDRIACSSGPATTATATHTLVPSAPASDSGRPADLVLERKRGAPDRVLDAASWTEVGAREHVYGAYSQRGGVAVLRAGEPEPGSPGTAVIVDGLAEGAAPATTLRVPSPLVLPPRVLAGLAYYAHVDAPTRSARAGMSAAPGARVGLVWLPDDARAPRPPLEQVRLATMPVQVLACVRPSGRALAFVMAVPTDGDEELPRTVEVHFYDANGSRTAVVGGELPGTGAVMDCVGDGVALLARKHVVVREHRALQLAGLRCATGGCEGAVVALSPMNDVPDAVMFGDARVLLVYRTAAAGGLRARVATLENLATAPEHVLSDEAAYGGIESTRRWLVRDGASALLVLETRVGVVVIRVTADGAAAFFAALMVSRA